MPRPRLTEHLDGGPGHGGRVILVSAPAGFGKTTLLATWLNERETSANSGARGVAWVSLDASDAAATSFWTYVVTALDRAAPGVGASTLSLLQTGREPTEELLAGLLNELSVLPGEVTLVLDDYHLADGPSVARDDVPGRPSPAAGASGHQHPRRPSPAAGSAACPRRAHRGPRGRPPVHGRRSDQLPERSNRPAPVAGDVAALEERTEGWVAALQLAALSLRGRDDAAGFIAGFAGDDRFVVDYLVEEVLDRQPEPVRRFLLATSILDRLTGALCDAVIGESGGGPMLEQLDRANLFLVPLDDQRRWYRYHHLFGDLLRSRLADEREDVAELHSRASNWHDQNGDPVAAVRHALAAGDVERAADLVELAVPELRRQRREGTLRHWVDQLPTSVVDRRPVLAMGFVGALMSSNEFDDIEHRLGVIEKAVEPADRTWWSSTTPSAADYPAASSCTGQVWPSSAATRPGPGSMLGARSSSHQTTTN